MLAYTSLELQSLRKSRKNDRFLAFVFVALSLVFGAAAIIAGKNLPVIAGISVVAHLVTIVFAFLKFSHARRPIGF